MELRISSPARAALATLSICGVLLLTGCPNPNTYSTPRTAGHGKINHSIALESWGYRFKDPDSGASVSGMVPTFPTYVLRIGLGDQFEIGGRLANFSSVGADLKWNFLRSRGFDMAIDPGIQAFKLSVSSTDGSGNSANSSVGVTYLHVPLLLGLNVSRNVTLMATPGFMWSIATGSASTSDGSNAAATTTGGFGRLGLGVDLRISSGFGLHPEVTFLHAFNDAGTTIYLLGIGFNFGGLPSYADLDENPAAPPPGAYQPPPPGYPPPPPPQ